MFIFSSSKKRLPQNYRNEKWLKIRQSIMKALKPSSIQQIHNNFVQIIAHSRNENNNYNHIDIMAV